ncbi:Eco57I restriction-modification methylase domain-containing protein [Phosphitispora fastidiosa]|uniref:Eco57I restriction-modification methylase domain-containing protein n=1 Tax=Phosphitispora fastidiosa TaxID=2837202 RepID=UPI001E612788|nr:N-6 DNA methylase [Phosphitispora fastidiosa]MBU7005135.1 hypothetical protein [Phosphitispora fastidiosa]
MQPILNAWSLAEAGGKEAEIVYKAAGLIAADMLLHQQVYENPGEYGNWSITQVVTRNAGLISCFSSFFADVSEIAADYQKTAALIKDYMCSVSTGEILHVPGQVFEASMGLRDSNKNSTVRKNTGSYYTPPDIVKFMVSRSAAEIIRVSKNKGIPKGFKAIDPACGGASFLIELFESLTGYGYSPAQALEAVYGTDLNPDAVELAVFLLTVLCLSKLSEHNCEELSSILKAKKIIEKNVIAANTITADRRVLYPWLFDTGISADLRGFNLVIGNPPYVSNKLISAAEKKQYREKYRSARGQYDLSVLFLEEGLELLGPEGLLCYITSNKFLAAEYGLNLRQLLLENYHVTEIIDVSTLKDFHGTAAYPVIITVANSRKTPAAERLINLINISCWENAHNCKPVVVKQDFFQQREEYLLTTELTEDTLPLINKLDSVKGRISRSQIACGLAVAGFGKWVTEELPGGTEENPHEHFLSFIQAGDITPYQVKPGAWIDGSKIKYGKMGKIKMPKLVIPGIARRLSAAVDYSGSLLGRVYYITNEDLFLNLRYLAVLFNSFLLNFYYRIVYWPIHLADGYLRFNSGYLAGIPVQGITGIQADLLKEIILTGAALETAVPGTREWEDLQNRAEAQVFGLYGFNAAEAKTVMNFLQTPAAKIEKIIGLMEGD